MTDSQRLARNAYMREWNCKNKDRVNKERRERYASLLDEEKEVKRGQSRQRNRRYYEKHKEEINVQARGRKWNYTPEKGATKRLDYDRKHPGARALHQRKVWAMNREVAFALDQEWFRAQFEKGCAVTGMPFAAIGSGSPWVPHIDRIAPEKGYTKTNCRLVCACYNLAKGPWTDEDVYDMALAILCRTSDA